MLRSAQRNINGAISAQLFKLFDGKFVFFDSTRKQAEGIIVDADLLSRLLHLFLNLFELSGPKFTS